MENYLEQALIFIKRWNFVFYGVGALGLILYFRQAREAFHERRYTPFPIEREEASAALRGALLIMLVLIAILGTTFYIDRVLLADLPSAGAEQSFWERAQNIFIPPTPPAIGLPTQEDEEGETPEGETPQEESAEPNQENSPESTPEGTAIEEEGTATEEESPAIEETATPIIMLSEEPVAACEAPGVNITSPANGEVISGDVVIMGNAAIDGFQSYKIEYGQGISPDSFDLLGEKLDPVEEGLLLDGVTDSFTSGLWTLRLTVLDEAGNAPTPCEIKIVIP